MAGAYVNSGSRIATAGATTLTATLPASLVTGNILVTEICVKNGDTVTISGSGWAILGTQVKIGTSFTALLAYRIVDGGEVSCIATWTNSAAAMVKMHQISGLASALLGATNSNSGTGTTHSVTGITTTRENSYVFYADLVGINNSTATPTGWTEDNDGGSATSATRGVVGHKIVAALGDASGDISVTGGNGNWVMFQYELLMPGGTLSVTQASDTVSATSTLQLQATASITQAGDTLAATGEIDIQGVASITQSGDSLSATATLQIQGTLSQSQAGDTLAAEGTITTAGGISGVLDITQAGDSVSSTSTLQIQGTASITQAADSASGAAGLQIQGVVSISQADNTIVSTGTLQLQATSAMSQADNTLSSAGTLSLAGALAITQAGDSLSGSGTLAITGTATITQDGNTITATATFGATTFDFSDTSVQFASASDILFTNDAKQLQFASDKETILNAVINSLMFSGDRTVQ